MKLSSFIPGGRASALVVAVMVTAVSVFAGGKQLWTAKLPGDAKWHSLTELGTLIVGTDSAILAYDPDTGQQLWARNEFKKTSSFNAREIAGTPFLICNTAEGFAGLTKTTFHAIDYLTGTTVWQTPPLSGQYLGTVTVPEKGLVLLVINGNGPDNKDPGTYIYAHNLSDGQQKWGMKFAKPGAIRLHIADNSGKFIPTTDLSGYHDPVVEGDYIYLPYLGCHCVDLNTGAIKWGAEMIVGGSELKKAHAPLRIKGDRIYGSAGGSVYALDKNTGAVVWKSDRISAYAGLLKARDNALVSQIEFVGDKIWARFGGYFSTGQATVLREPLGIVALNPATGEGVYHFDDAKEGLTNLMVLPESNVVMFADAGNLYGIDTGAGAPKEAFRVPIEFKRKIGGGEIAQIGLGALGGIRGLAKAAIAQNKARLDVPVAIQRRGGQIVVQGKQHLMCFDPVGKKISWATYCASPSEAFGMTAMFAVTALASLQGNAMALQSGNYGMSDNGVQLIHNSLDSYNRQAGKRKSATKGSDNYSFLLTQVDDGTEKGVGLIGINLANGEGEKKFVLGTKEPDYRVDEAVNRLFFFKGKDTLVAYGL
jgi:outer membrane protein assembly factor BamB